MSEEEQKAPAPPEERASPPGIDGKQLSVLNENLAKLSLRLEQMNLAELVEVTQKPVKLMWMNFLGGLTRGVGLFLGAGVMGAITLAFVTWMVYYMLDAFNWIPVIGQFTHAVGDILKQFLQSHPKK
jgi:hypothetical protein